MNGFAKKMFKINFTMQFNALWINNSDISYFPCGISRFNNA